MITVKRVKKIYQDATKAAISNVSFELDTGKWLTLVGESGCGKTTLLRCIAGLENLSGGDISIHGDPVIGPQDKLVAGHPEAGLVHQDLELFPNHKVKDILNFKVRNYSKEYQEYRTEQVVKLCKLGTMLDKVPRELSGGQPQRVAIAHALIDEPALLLLDEPFSHLDIVTRRRLWKLLRRVVDETDTSIIFVTHDAQEALHYSDRMMMMKSGRVIQEGTAMDMYHRPATKYVMDFFGETNYFTIEDLKVIGLNKRKKGRYGLKAEYCSVKRGGKIKAEVKDRIFCGGYYILELEIEGLKSSVFAYELGDSTSIGDNVKLSFDFSQLRFF